MQILISILGMALLMAIAYALSSNRGAINRRTVVLAFLIQAGIAILILYVPQGKQALTGLVSGIQHVINYGNAGIEFVFGITVVDHVLNTVNETC